jgi:hypothetical protein
MGSIFKWLVGGLASKSLFIGIQITVAVALVSAHVAMLIFVVGLILFVYNKYNELTELIASFTAQSEIFGIALNILQSMGVFQAFSDVSALFMLIIIGYFTYLGGKIVFHSLKMTSDEIFKIGVLAQQ